MKVRFLLDENLTPRLKTAVLRLNPKIDIVRIGDPNTLPLGSLDPEVLLYLERSQRILVTDNRTSMPGHLVAISTLSKYLDTCSCSHYQVEGCGCDWSTVAI